MKYSRAKPNIANAITNVNVRIACSIYVKFMLQFAHIHTPNTHINQFESILCILTFPMNSKKWRNSVFDFFQKGWEKKEKNHPDSMRNPKFLERFLFGAEAVRRGNRKKIISICNVYCKKPHKSTMVNVWQCDIFGNNFSVVSFKWVCRQQKKCEFPPWNSVRVCRSRKQKTNILCTVRSCVQNIFFFFWSSFVHNSHIPNDFYIFTTSFGAISKMFQFDFLEWGVVCVCMCMANCQFNSNIYVDVFPFISLSILICLTYASFVSPSLASVSEWVYKSGNTDVKLHSMCQHH